MGICTYVRMSTKGGQGSCSTPPHPPKGGLDKSIYSLYFLPFQGIPYTPPKMLYDKFPPPWDFIIYTYVVIYITTNGHMGICTYVSICTLLYIYITIYVHMGIYTLLHSYICSYIHNDKCPYVYMYIWALYHSFICRLFYSFICSPCPSIPLPPYTPLKSLLRAL